MSSINIELPDHEMNNGLIIHKELKQKRNTIQSSNYGFSDQRVALIDQEIMRRKLVKKDYTRHKSMDIT